MENLIIDLILLLIFAGITLACMAVSIPQLAVLLLQLFWPTVPATVRGNVKKTVSQGKTTTYERDHDTGDYEFETRKSTKVEWFPQLRFDYQWQERSYQKDNQDGWNHRWHYGEGSSKRTVEHFRSQSPYPLKINPQQPQMIFLGLGQFPLITVLLSTLGGILFLVVSLKTLFEMLPANPVTTLGNLFYWPTGICLYLLIFVGVAFKTSSPANSHANSHSKKS